MLLYRVVAYVGSVKDTAVVRRDHVAELIREERASPRHHPRGEGHVVVRGKVEVNRLRVVGSVGRVLGEERVKEAAFPLVLYREVEVREIEHRNGVEYPD